MYLLYINVYRDAAAAQQNEVHALDSQPSRVRDRVLDQLVATDIVVHRRDVTERTEGRFQLWPGTSLVCILHHNAAHTNVCYRHLH